MRQHLICIFRYFIFIEAVARDLLRIVQRCRAINRAQRFPHMVEQSPPLTLATGLRLVIVVRLARSVLRLSYLEINR